MNETRSGAATPALGARPSRATDTQSERETDKRRLPGGRFFGLAIIPRRVGLWLVAKPAAGQWYATNRNPFRAWFCVGPSVPGKFIVRANPGWMTGHRRRSTVGPVIAYFAVHQLFRNSDSQFLLRCSTSCGGLAFGETRILVSAATISGTDDLPLACDGQPRHSGRSPWTDRSPAKKS